MRLRVRRLHPAARIPSRAHPGDAGLDLHSVESVDLAPGERARIATGIAIELPDDHAGWVVPRSGLAARHGVGLVNAPGLIDSGYRGELAVVLINLDREAAFSVEAGMRIAQLVVSRVAAPEPIEVVELEASARGTGGFGSTGA